MKTIYFTCLLLLSALVGRGQPTEWFPVGATWSCIYSDLVGFGPTFKYICEKDTIIEGRSTKKITNESNPNAKYYLYQKNDSIYIYLDQTFLEYYNFSKQVGDSMNSVFLVDRDFQIMKVRIDSIGIFNISGESLRFMLVSNSSRGKLTIVEKLGYIKLNVNFPNQYEKYWYSNFENSDLTPAGINLLCYSDKNTNIRFVNNEDRCSGEYLVSRQNYDWKGECTKLYQKNNQLFILSEKKVIYIKLIDTKGKAILSKSNIGQFESSINLEDISNGVYYLSIGYKNSNEYKKINISK